MIFAYGGPPKDLSTLSVRGIGDFANALLSDHVGVRAARENLNAEYLRRLSFSGDKLEGQISVSGSRGDPDLRLRLLLEKLDLELRDAATRITGEPWSWIKQHSFHGYELLLLGSEAEGVSIAAY